MKPYPEYKETGLSWLPKIPKHWDVVKIREIFSERKQRVSDEEYKPLSVCKVGIVPQLDGVAKTENGGNRKLVCVGDFVINSRSDRRSSSGISSYEGSVSLINIVLRPRISCKGFLHYLLKSELFVEEFYRNGRGIVADLWTTRLSEMKGISVPLPPANEQEKIVRYLDLMTAKIDKLIAAKKKQIALLQEKKQAIVNQVVTRGLNPDVQLKDSGIDWLGKIPAHWEMKKLRHLLHAVTEKNHPDSPLLSVVREKGVILRDTENKEENHNFIPEDLSNYKFVKMGQFVVNKMKAWQGSYGISSYEGIVSPAYFVFNLRGSLFLFFHASIRSKFYSAQFARASDGIRVGQWDLSIPRMKEILFLEPSEEEQRAIVRYLDLLISKINKVLSAYKSQCRVLLEYRDNLVSSIVTGRLDVREMADEEVKINF